jgi:hypothetical protein
MNVWAILKATWGTPGVSEFLSAALGGAMAMAAQWIALRHDRKKEEAKRSDEQKGTAWAIYFKISQAFEQFTWVWQEMREARELANQSARQLWQVFQAPPHDLKPISLETSELVFLIDHKRFDLMENYRLVTVWTTNLAQSLQKFGEMRLEFLSCIPSEMKGQQGSFFVDETNRREIMPRISFLQSLCDSLEEVVNAQRPDLRKLLLDYVAAMKSMIGSSPQLQLTDTQKAGDSERDHHAALGQPFVET